MSSDPYVAPSNPVSRAGAGVVGGLAGGLILAIALTILGHIRPVAQIFGKTSIEVGWTVLLLIAAIAGCVYGFLVGRAVSAQIVPAIGIGIAYGGAWWIIVQLIAVPLATSRTMFALQNDSILVLGAYVVFGVVLGLVYAMAGPRRRQYARWSGSRAYNMVYSMPRPRRPRRRRRSS